MFPFSGFRRFFLSRPRSFPLTRLQQTTCQSQHPHLFPRTHTNRSKHAPIIQYASIYIRSKTASVCSITTVLNVSNTSLTKHSNSLPKIKMNSTTTKSAKKPKKEKTQEEEELDIVRNYILQCNLVSKDSRAIQAALKGLDTEMKRIERDAKLRQKFSKSAVATSTEESEPQTVMKEKQSLSDSYGSGDGVVEVNHSDVVDDAALMEWQDVGNDTSTTEGVAVDNNTGTTGSSTEDCYTDSQLVHPHKGHKDVNTANDNSLTHHDSVLGRQLAQGAITSMSNANIYVTTPLAAIALALHAALVDKLDFACTGIPPTESEAKKMSGFAPPIRVLPKTKFVPDNWDQYASTTMNEAPCHVALRYRKDGIGAVVLNITLEESSLGQEKGGEGITTTSATSSSSTTSNLSKVHVEMKPANTKEPQPNDGLVFELHEYINFNSFTTALQGSQLKKGKGILPALHYKQLHQLMQRFCTAFDLGPIEDNEDNKNDASIGIPVPVSFPKTSTTTIMTASSNNRNYPPLMVEPVGGTRGNNNHGIPTIDQFTNDNDPYRNGDFQGDLIPGGPPGGPSIGGGNLMGPDHPMFTGGGNGEYDGSGMGINIPRVGGGNWMQPRFDPYGPPGGPTDPAFPGRGGPGRGHGGRGRGRGRGPTRPPPGGSGDPNPDHQRPPSDLGNHMFM